MKMLALAAAFQEDPYSGGEGGGLIAALISGVFGLGGLLVLIVVLVALWKIFEKAGKPGWAGLVPIYNIVVLLEIIGKPIWWIVLFLIPCVNIVASILVAVELAKCFGKSTGFAIGLVLLPFIFYPILGFGDARYQAPPPAA